MRDYGASPLRALLLGLPLGLTLGALLADAAYYRSYEVQWVNFASWLIAGALLTGALVVLLALVDLVRGREGRGRAGLFLLLVAAMWLVGLFNALIHARDSWASMPAGLILSAVMAAIGLVAAVVGVASPRQEARR